MFGEFRLWNWRNCERARFAFSARKNLLIGPNGAGKSNLLEAIGFLGTLRSFRTSRVQDLPKIGATGFGLRGDWLGANGTRTRLEIVDDGSGKRRLSVNENPAPSGRDFIQYFQPVVFAPEDIELVSGAPAARRRFFDMLSSQLDPGYMNVLHDYARALHARSLALKRGPRADVKVLEAYEGLLAFAAADLTARRTACVEKFNRNLTILERDQDSRIRVEYRPQCGGTPEDWLALFERGRAKEMERRASLTGCHLDDFHVWRGDLPMRGIASNGQNRLAALNLKLAAAEMVIQDRGAEQLVVLADDVTGDLDAAHRAQFFRTVAHAGQLFFTFTQRPEDEYFKDAAEWQIGGV